MKITKLLNKSVKSNIVVKLLYNKSYSYAVSGLRYRVGAMVIYPEEDNSVADIALEFTVYHTGNEHSDLTEHYIRLFIKDSNITNNEYITDSKIYPVKAIKRVSIYREVLNKRASSIVIGDEHLGYIEFSNQGVGLDRTEKVMNSDLPVILTNKPINLFGIDIAPNSNRSGIDYKDNFIKLDFDVLKDSEEILLLGSESLKYDKGVRAIKEQVSDLKSDTETYNAIVDKTVNTLLNSSKKIHEGVLEEKSLQDKIEHNKRLKEIELSYIERDRELTLDNKKRLLDFELESKRQNYKLDSKRDMDKYKLSKKLSKLTLEEKEQLLRYKEKGLKLDMIKQENDLWYRQAVDAITLKQKSRGLLEDTVKTIGGLVKKL